MKRTDANNPVPRGRHAAPSTNPQRAMSLHDLESALYQQVFARGEQYWPLDILPNEQQVIVRDDVNRELWQASYTVSEDDSLMLADTDEWQRVVREYVPVETTRGGQRRQQFTGGYARALGDGRIGGYLVYFNPDEPDLYGTYFTADTYYGPRNGDGADFYIHHSIPLRAGLEDLADRILKPIRTRKEDVGIWVEAVLDMADEYERAIYDLVQAGKLSWSSATTPHIARIAPDGRVERWPIAEGSLTPFPGGFGTRASTRSHTPPAHAAPEGATTMEEDQIQSPPAGTNEPDEGTRTPQEQPHSPPPAQPQAAPTRQAPAPPPAPGEPAQPAPQAAMSFDPEAMRALFTDLMQPVVENVTALGQQVEELRSAPAVQRDPRFVPGDTNSGQQQEQPDPMRAFDRYVRTGRWVRGLETSTVQAGGALVPAALSDEIVRSLNDISILRQAGARVETVSNVGEYQISQQVDSSMASILREGQTSAEDEPTFVRHNMRPVTFTRITRATYQQLEDTRLNVLQDVIMPDATQAFAAAENHYFAVGNGAGEPQGLTVGGTRGKKAAATTAIEADDIKDLYFSLNYLYRPNAVWVMNDSTAAYLQKIKDAEGRYIWSDPRENVPASMMGRPVITLNTMPEIGADKKVIVFADLNRAFRIVDFSMMSMQRLDQKYADTLEIGFLWWKRIDAKVVLPEAVQYLEMQ